MISDKGHIPDWNVVTSAILNELDLNTVEYLIVETMKHYTDISNEVLTSLAQKIKYGPILQKYYKACKANIYNDSECTILHLICKNHSIQVIKNCIKKCVWHVNFEDTYRRTPMYYLSARNDINIREIIPLICSNGTNINRDVMRIILGRNDVLNILNENSVDFLKALTVMGEK